MTYERMLSIAHDDMGIYPQARIEPDGTIIERTEWQNGWNAYGTELIEKIGKIAEWLNSVPQEQRSIIEDLSAIEKLEISIHEEGIRLYVNCNDLFYWACADAEQLQLSELEAYQKTLDECPDGDLLWCCRKRGMRPQKPYYKYFSPEEVPLFDAVGPERTE